MGGKVCRTRVCFTIETQRVEVGVGRAYRRPHLKGMERMDRGVDNSI